MNCIRLILCALISVFLLSCNNSRIKPLDDISQYELDGTNQYEINQYLQTKTPPRFDMENATSYTEKHYPQQLNNLRTQAYDTLFNHRLGPWGLKSYYLIDNGFAAVTNRNSISTLEFRDFIRNAFCPMLRDLPQSFGKVKRVILLNSKAKQGRWMDYTNQFCWDILKMSVFEANRKIFPLIMTY